MRVPTIWRGNRVTLGFSPLPILLAPKPTLVTGGLGVDQRHCGMVGQSTLSANRYLAFRLADLEMYSRKSR
jgi:hypothetical protein